jgi:hypothetical protein
MNERPKSCAVVKTLVVWARAYFGELPLEHALSLFDREDSARILLFGGGFTRDALVESCRSELRACGGDA